HNVGQRIHLRAEPGRCLEQPRQTPVHAIEKGGQKHHDGRRFEPVLEGKAYPRKPGADGENRNQIRKHEPKRSRAYAGTTLAVMVEPLEGCAHLSPTKSEPTAQHGRRRIQPGPSHPPPPSAPPPRAAPRLPGGKRPPANRSGSIQNARRRKAPIRARPSRGCAGPPDRRPAPRRQAR